MKKTLHIPIICIFCALPALIHAQEPALCDFNYGTYSEYSTMPVSSSSTAIGLIDGKIYLTGGYDWSDISIPDHLQVYDPETDSWDTTKARLPVPRAIYGGGDMALDGKLYVIGGMDWVNLGGGNWQMVPHARVDVYDPQSDTWELKANLPIPIGGKAVCSLNDKLYVTGGLSTDQAALNTLLCYDPGTDKWTELSGMGTARLFHVSVALDGKIYVISGADGGGATGATNTCEVYNPDKDQWTAIAPLPHPRVFGAAGVVDGEIYIIGGAPYGSADPSKIVYKYNPAMDSWIKIDNMEPALKEHVLVPDGRTIYMFGVSESFAQSTLAYELSDIRLDAKIPGDTISGDVLDLDLSKYFSHVDGSEITYSYCFDDSGILDVSVEGSMLAVTGLSLGSAEVSVLAESGEDQMGDVFQVHVKSPTGIDEMCEIPPSLLIYPNPTQNLVTMEYRVQSLGVVRLEIYDLLGRRMANPVNEYQVPGEYNYQLDTGDFEPGVYFCKLYTAKEKITVKLVVKQ